MAVEIIGMIDKTSKFTAKDGMMYFEIYFYINHKMRTVYKKIIKNI